MAWSCQKGVGGDLIESRSAWDIQKEEARPVEICVQQAGNTGKSEIPFQLFLDM